MTMKKTTISVADQQQQQRQQQRQQQQQHQQQRVRQHSTVSRLSTGKQQMTNLRTKSVDSCSSPSSASQDSQLSESQMSSSLDHNCLVVDLSTPVSTAHNGNNSVNISATSATLHTNRHNHAAHKHIQQQPNDNNHNNHNNHSNHKHNNHKHNHNNHNNNNKLSTLFTIDSLLGKDSSFKKLAAATSSAIVTQQRQYNQTNFKLIRRLLTQHQHTTTSNNNNDNKLANGANKTLKHIGADSVNETHDNTNKIGDNMNQISVNQINVNQINVNQISMNVSTEEQLRRNKRAHPSGQTDGAKTVSSKKRRLDRPATIKINQNSGSQQDVPKQRLDLVSTNGKTFHQPDKCGGQTHSASNCIVHEDDNSCGDNSLDNLMDLNGHSKGSAEADNANNNESTDRQSDEANFQEWVVRIYGNSSKTKTITRDKYNKIVNYLSCCDKTNQQQQQRSMAVSLYTPEQQATLARLCRAGDLHHQQQQHDKCLKNQQKSSCLLPHCNHNNNHNNNPDSDNNHETVTTCNNNSTTSNTNKPQTDQCNREELRFQTWVKSKGFVLVRESKIIQDSMDAMLARQAQKQQSKQQTLRPPTNGHCNGKSSSPDDHSDAEDGDTHLGLHHPLMSVKTSHRKRFPDDDPLVLCVPSCSVGGNGRPVRDDRHHGNPVGALADQRRARCSPSSGVNQNHDLERISPLESPRSHQSIINSNANNCGPYSLSPTSSCIDQLGQQNYDYDPSKQDGLNLINRPQLKQVAIVEDFFEIISDIHDQIIGRIRFGKHMGQKRTFQAVTDRYAFLPREAVTKFLMSCRHCSRRMRTKNRFVVDSAVYLRKTDNIFAASSIAAVQSKEANVAPAGQNNRSKQRQKKQSDRNNTDSSSTTPVSSLGSNSPTLSLSDHCHLSDRSAIMIDRPSLHHSKTSSITPPYHHQLQHHNRLYDDSSPASDGYRAFVASWNVDNKTDDKEHSHHHELIKNKLDDQTHSCKEDFKERRLPSDRQQYSHGRSQQINAWCNHLSEKRSESSNSVAETNKEPVLDLSGVSHRDATANRLVSDATNMLLLHERLRELQQPPEFKPLRINNDCHHLNDRNGILGIPYQNWLDNVRFNHIDWYRSLYNQAAMMNILTPPSQQADRSIFSPIPIGPDLRSCQVMDLTNKQPNGIKHSLLGSIYRH